MNVTAENITDLIDKYGDTVLRVAYTYMKNQADAEDIVQDVYMYLIDKSPEFNDDNHVKAWLIRATVNKCKNEINRFWNRNKRSMDAVADVSCCDRYSTDSNVMQAVMNLPEKHRIVVYMYYYEGYTTVEISKILGKPESTVRSCLYRARTSLKNILKEDYDFEQ